MNTWDYLVLFGTIAAIAVYGILRTRGRRNLHDYLRGKRHSWFAIGLSVMATQASAITFLSTPGQGYQDGMSFVQNYFAVPLALVIIAAFFLPIYRKLNVYTAYEYLSTRFDKKTRLLAAALFLLQRALAAGYTLYAPAIVLSTVFGWSLFWTILLAGIVVIAYTVVGGSDAVTHTQKYQIAIIFAGMIAAFCILLSKIPCSFPDALSLAGHFGKLNAVDFSLDPRKRYTFWTGMLGGIFLMLSYFGTDQSQVQRYISGDDLRESRLGLMFNALFKIPMQFFILLLGIMLFVFYQFNLSPIMFNRSTFNSNAPYFENQYAQAPDSLTKQPWSIGWSLAAGATSPEGSMKVLDLFKQSELAKHTQLQNWLTARQRGDSQAENLAMAAADESARKASFVRSYVKESALQLSHSTANENDFVFITFILDYLPHGLIGLLVASFFLAALSSKAAELNALASCSVIDFYRYLIRPPEARAPKSHGFPVVTQSDSSPAPLSSAQPPNSELRTNNSELKSDRHYVRASKAFTILWGIIALFFALFVFPHFAENLIQATNIVGSIFYGGILGLFLLAFFFKPIRGSAAFWGAIIGQTAVFAFMTLNYFGQLNVAYLWYNPIGCLITLAAAAILQLFLPQPPESQRGFPVIENSSSPQDTARGTP